MATVLKKNDPERAGQYFADKMAFTTGPIEVANNLKQGTDLVVIDVREEEDYKKGHVPGAINIPIHELEKRIKDLPKRREVVAYCRGPYCLMSYDAVSVLRKRGLKARRLQAGMPEWRAAGLPVDRHHEI